jgi:nicotinic acid mononucleotide adenylyltransferase
MPDEISSSGAKKLLSEGGNLDQHLDKNVMDYIIKKNLYKEHLNVGAGKQ